MPKDTPIFLKMLEHVGISGTYVTTEKTFVVRADSTTYEAQLTGAVS